LDAKTDIQFQTIKLHVNPIDASLQEQSLLTGPTTLTAVFSLAQSARVLLMVFASYATEMNTMKVTFKRVYNAILQPFLNPPLNVLFAFQT
jgi:hypothetical protein